jgi:hypothetical protein
MLASLLGWVSKRHMTSRSGVFSTQPARREPAARSNRLLSNRTHNRTHLGTDMGIATIPHKNTDYLSMPYMI